MEVLNTESDKGKKVSIGGLIKEQFEKSNLSIDEFACLIACKRDNVYDIFRREQINTDLLFIISKILKFDFFKIYSEQIRNQMMTQIRLTINIPREEMEKGNICEYCKWNKNSIL